MESRLLTPSLSASGFRPMYSSTETVPSRCEPIAGSKNQTATDGERTKFSTENCLLLKNPGETEVDFPSEQVGDRVATLCNRLETYPESDWTEWVRSCAAIEAAAGVLLAKNQYAGRTAMLEAQGTVPEMLKQIPAKAGGA